MTSTLARTWHRLAGILLVVTVAAACSPGAKGGSAPGTTGPSSPRPSSTKPTPTPPPAPEVGECRDLGFADVSLFSNNTDPVPCRRDHTSYTFAVTQLPKDVAFEGVSIDNDAVQEAAASACHSAFASFIGGDPATRALARLTVTYFLSPQHGFDLGAHWARCDAIALQGQNSLAPLPRNVEGLLDDGSALAAYGVCSQNEPGTAAARLVMCTQDHGFRALAALRLGPADGPYPGAQTTRVDGKQRCETLVADELGKEGGFSYVWTFPSAADWDDGQTFGYCWFQTTR